MRRTVSLLVAVALTAGLTLVAAAPSGASVATKTSPFCKALKNVDATGIGNPTSKKSAAKIAKQLKKLQRQAKGSTASAIGVIVVAYTKLARGESVVKVFLSGKFVKAATTFAAAAVKCAGSELPDITLPKNITLPDITLPEITLPGR